MSKWKSLGCVRRALGSITSRCPDKEPALLLLRLGPDSRVYLLRRGSKGLFRVGRIRWALWMQAQGYVKGDCQIHWIVRLHSADFQNEPTERTFEPLRSREGTHTWPLRKNSLCSFSLAWAHDSVPVCSASKSMFNFPIKFPCPRI